MDQDKFDHLTGVCDQLLRKFSAKDAIAAIPWLHVLNGHPNSTDQYRYAFHKRGFFSAIGVFLYHVAYILYKLVVSVTGFNTNKISVKQIEASDILFVSHLVTAEISDRNRDFYYGTLPAFLEQSKELAIMIGLIDHTASGKLNRAKIEEGKPQRIVFPKTLSFPDEIKFAYKSLYSFCRLLKESYRAKQKDIRIIREAALHAMSPATMAAMRIQEITRKLLQITGAKTVVVTWEGRSWERLIMHTAHSMHPELHCMGYQHTVLMESTHALKRSFGKSYDADIIFTIGKATADMIRAARHTENTTVIAYGSYRLAKTYRERIQFSQNNLQCLVTPEGIESECVLLFNFAIQLAMQQKEMLFIFRTHPVLPYQMLAEKYKQFAKLPANCIVSELPDINEDFKRSDLLLYRGSSVCVYAAMQGLMPVYYALPEEISIDPLYQLHNWRIPVQNAADFFEAVHVYAIMPTEVKREKYQAALTFCKEYLQVPDENYFYNHILSEN